MTPRTADAADGLNWDEPFRLFEQSEKPEGFYVRHNWMGLRGREKIRLRNKILKELSDGQTADGRFGSLEKTIARVFGMYLIGALASPTARRAVEYLKGGIWRDFGVFDPTPIAGENFEVLFLGEEEAPDPVSMAQTPFLPGKSRDGLKISSALFFLGQSGAAELPDTLRLVSILSGHVLSGDGEIEDDFNAMIGMSGHPRLARSEFARLLAQRVIEKRPIREPLEAGGHVWNYLWGLSRMPQPMARQAVKQSLPLILQSIRRRAIKPDTRGFLLLSVLKKCGALP